MSRSKEDLPEYVADRTGPHRSLGTVLATDGSLLALALLAAWAVSGPPMTLSSPEAAELSASRPALRVDETTGFDARKMSARPLSETVDCERTAELAVREARTTRDL
ncbi:hypothetical protein ACUSIJ_11190 [Pseudochelatococcus sp. B33]